MFNWLRQRLIDDWRLGWRFWSVRFGGLAIALQTLLLSWASLPLDLWNMMPSEVKAHVPPRIAFALPAVFFAAAMAARFIQQGKKDDGSTDGYALTVHGTLNRDIDLVAVPWREHGVWSKEALIDALCGAVRGITGRCNHFDHEVWTVKPHGRFAKGMHVWCGESGAHLDLSVMPARPEKEKD